MKQVKNIAILLCLLSAGCTITTSPSTPAKKIKTITETEWALREIRTPEVAITLERPMLALAGIGDTYILRFEGENRALGTTASTYYTAPCAWREDSTVTFGAVTTVRAAVVRELPFKEEHFFECLKRINQWNITDRGELVLRASGYGEDHWIMLTFEKW